MDIQIASNTPALVNQIIGSSQLAQSENGSIINAVVNIDSLEKSYTDNSVITITSIETYYSELGLLSSPLTAEALQESKSLKVSSGSLSSTYSSILNTDLQVKSLYEEASNMINNSTESIDTITKETYLLLSIQYLVNCSLAISDNLAHYCSIDTTLYNDIYLNKIIKNINNIGKSFSKLLRYMNNLIGHYQVTFNYASAMLDELIKAADLFCFIIDDMTNINENTTSAHNISLQSISENIKNCCRYDNFSEGNIPQFPYFKDNLSILIHSFDEILQVTTEYVSKKVNTESMNTLYSINNSKKSIDHIASAIFLAYSGISKNYNLIISNIRSALSFISLISIMPASVNKLSTEINSEIFLGSSDFDFAMKNDISNITDSITNLSQSFNYISSNGKKQILQNNIDDSKQKTDLNKLNAHALDSSTDKTSSENIELTLSFFVCNLKIIISGTIGADEFTGYIYYPEIYNLNYFGITDIQIDTSIDIPQSINSFKVNECLSPQLTTSSVTALSPYSLSSPNIFYANAALTFSLAGEIILSALLPIVFPQS